MFIVVEFVNDKMLRQRNQMIENTDGFNNNPEDRHNNPKHCETGFVYYKIVSPNKQKNYPNEK